MRSRKSSEHITLFLTIVIFFSSYSSGVYHIISHRSHYSGALSPRKSYASLRPAVEQTQILSKNEKEEQVSFGDGDITVLKTPKQQITQQVAGASTSTPGDWGVAHQIDEHTWTMKIGQDDHMGTPQEIYAALNAYRQRNGRGALSWDQQLADYAQSRASTFNGLHTTDKHAGFNEFVTNQDGFSKLGFNGLGENSSYGYLVIGVHLIEWVYAADAPHNDNQLSSNWTHVGVGVSGLGTDLIFGGNKR